MPSRETPTNLHRAGMWRAFKHSVILAVSYLLIHENPELNSLKSRDYGMLGLLPPWHSIKSSFFLRSLYCPDYADVSFIFYTM